MKKLFLLLLITISISSFSQSKAKQDSLLQVEANKFIDTLTHSVSVADFAGWVNSNQDKLSALQFNQFSALYNDFIKQQVSLWVERKKKTK